MARQLAPARPMASTRHRAASPATVNDVARAAGVSRQTVSNVLNAPERVHPSTRARVTAAISQLGYRPDRAARSLKVRRTRLLGYRVPQVDLPALNPVMDGFLHALTDAARREGYQVLLFTPEQGQSEVEVHEEMIASHAADGYVLSGIDYHDPRVSFLAECAVPFAAFGRTGLETFHAWVDVDGAAGTEQAVLHLAARGHRRIAHLGWVKGSTSGDHRAAGYRRGLAKAGLPFEEQLELRVATEQGLAAAERLLGLDDPPTAIATASDALAFHVLEVARARGLRVGVDLAVVGFDDVPAAAFTAPALTTLRQPLVEVARQIVRLLVARIAEATPDPKGVLVAPQLVVRASS